MNKSLTKEYKLKHQTVVSKTLAYLIAELNHRLTLECSGDFAYTIMGHGHIIAASNMVDGLIEPRTPGQVDTIKQRNPSCCQICGGPNH